MKSLEQIFGRVAIPMVTPFNESSEVNHTRAGELAEWLLEKGYCDSLIIEGTNGEFSSLSYSERIEMFETMATFRSQVKLIAGTGACTTAETIELTRKAESLGYDAIMVLPSYFGIPTQDELYEHFHEVANATSLPIVLYNIPLFTGVNIEPETTVKLSSIDNIIGIKDEAALKPLQASEVLRLLPEDTDFAVYCGDDTMVLSVLAQGGSGAVSGSSHVMGDVMKRMIAAYFDGDIDEATDHHRTIYRFVTALGVGGRINPVPLTKAALSLVGFDVGKPRRPFLPPGEKEVEKMRALLKTIGKI